MTITEFTERIKPYGPAIVRVGIALVYLYFGISQLRNPSSFIGWLPTEAALIPLSSRTLIIMNGTFEIFLGSLLLLGLYTRISALLLGLHLAAITVSVGFNDIGARDFGLTLATLSLAFSGSKLNLDSFFKHKKERFKAQ